MDPGKASSPWGCAGGGSFGGVADALAPPRALVRLARVWSRKGSSARVDGSAKGQFLAL